MRQDDLSPSRRGVGDPNTRRESEFTLKCAGKINFAGTVSLVSAALRVIYMI